MNANVIAAAYLLTQPHTSKIVADLNFLMDDFTSDDYKEMRFYMEKGTFQK